jgi:Fe-S-cluster containining protein
VVAGAERRSEATGKPISCSKGCAACCAQLVPISEAQARELSGMIRRWPKARRAAITQRFVPAREKFQESDIWDKLSRLCTTSDAIDPDLMLRYFSERISCLFLEDGACSIHPQRPVVCREYLVTSDPKHCSTPGEGRIDGVQIPLRVSLMMNRVVDQADGAGAGWLPLITLQDLNAQ